jgi:hypothetical protein
MAKMKSLNGYEIVDESARERLTALENGGGNDITAYGYSPETIKKTYTELTEENINDSSLAVGVVGIFGLKALYGLGYKFRTSITWDGFVGLPKSKYVFGSLCYLTTPYCSFSGFVGPSFFPTNGAIFPETLFDDLDGTVNAYHKVVVVYNTTSIDIYSQDEYMLDQSTDPLSVKLWAIG